MISIFILLGFVLLLFTGIPIAFAMIFMAMFFIYFFGVGGEGLIIPFTRLSSGFSFPLLAIFCFILLSFLMEETHISEILINFIRRSMGKIFRTGRTGTIMILACAATGSITGSAVGTTSAIGGVLIPHMKKNKYDLKYSTTLLAYSGILGSLIPPSITGLVYAMIVQLPVFTTWVAVAGSGVLYACVLLIINYFISKKRKYETCDEDSEESSISMLKSFIIALPTILVPVSVLGSIYFGIATPTEAGSVGCVMVIILSVFYYRTITSIKQIFKVLFIAAYHTARIMIIICASFSLSYVLITTGFVKDLARSILLITDNKYYLLLLTEFLLLILGCFLDDVPIMVLLAPLAAAILIPVGIHPFHLAAVFVFTCLIGLVTPPVGVVLYAASAVSGVSVGDMIKDVFGFLWPALVTLLIITFFPALVLFLPRTLGLIQ